MVFFSQKPNKVALLIMLLMLLYCNPLYSCALDASISGNTSICAGSTTLTVNATGTSACAGTETLGLFYSLDDCTNPELTGFPGSFPTTVSPSSPPCNVSFDQYNMFFGNNQNYSCNATFGGIGAEGSTTGMCTHGYLGNNFCGDVMISNNCNAGFFSE